MDFESRRRILMEVPRMSQRSVSPISPTRSQQGHLSHWQQPEDDSGCSTDSCSSSGAGPHLSSASNLSNLTGHDDSSSTHFDQSNMELASVSSSSSNSSDEQQRIKSSVHFRSTSSLRRVLRSLSISTRSLSCTGSRERSEDDDDHFEYEKRVSFKTGPEVALNKPEQQRKKAAKHIIAQRSKTPPPQRRILRQPVSYLYLKGISGLPTQRVPLSSLCCTQGYHR